MRIVFAYLILIKQIARSKTPTDKDEWTDRVRDEVGNLCNLNSKSFTYSLDGTAVDALWRDVHAVALHVFKVQLALRCTHI